MIVVPNTYVKHTEADFSSMFAVRDQVTRAAVAAKDRLTAVFKQNHSGCASKDIVTTAYFRLMGQTANAALQRCSLARQLGLAASVMINCPGKYSVMEQKDGVFVTTSFPDDEAVFSGNAFETLDVANDNAQLCMSLIRIVADESTRTPLPFPPQKAVQINTSFRQANDLHAFAKNLPSSHMEPGSQPHKAFRQELTRQFGNFSSAPMEIIEDVMWKVLQEDRADGQRHIAMIDSLTSYLTLLPDPPAKTVQQNQNMFILAQLAL